MTPYWKVERRDPRIGRLLKQAKRRAKEKGLDYDLEHSDIVIPDVCPILGVPFKKHEGKMERLVPSLDRVDSSKGYVKGNVRVITWWANYLKEQLTLEQISNLKEYVEGKR